VSVPERRYELLARLLARAAASTRGASKALAHAARELGEAIGAEARSAAGPRPSKDRLIAAAHTALEGLGFQPFRDATGTLRLRNCPFDAVARDHQDVICAMNLDLVDGVLEGMAAKGVAATLEPAAGRCCVAVRRVP
jgi:predicted ArsR family transcriptional regulator